MQGNIKQKCRCNLSRCCAHTWFFMACCCFVVISSLPRVIAIADFICTFIVYWLEIQKTDTKDKNIFHYMAWDFSHYTFQQHAVEILILSMVRSIFLFRVYAYRYHLNRSTFNASTLTMIISSIYCIVKMSAFDPIKPFFNLIVMSLLISVGEYAAYMAVRRNRILGPDISDERFKNLLHNLQPSPGYLAPNTAARYLTPGYSTHMLNKDNDYKSPYIYTSESSKYKSNSVHSNSSDSPAYSSNRDVIMKGEYIDAMALADSDSKFITVDSIKVHYKYTEVPNHSEAGDVCLILMHGFGGSIFSWHQCWKYLSELEYVSSILAFDRPGFGLTSRPLSHGGSYGTYSRKKKNGGYEYISQINPYNPEYSIRIATCLIEELNICNAIVIGHDTAGSLAISLSLEKPDSILGLLLIAPHIYSEGFPKFLLSMFRTRLGKSLVRQLVRSEIGEVAIRRAWYNPSSIPKEVMANYKNTSLIKNWHEALVEMGSSAKPNLISKRLKDVTAPVHILHGDNDKVVAVIDSQKAVRCLLDSQAASAMLILIEKCGHVPHQEHPEVFVEEVDRFIREQIMRTNFGARDPFISQLSTSTSPQRDSSIEAYMMMPRHSV